MRRVSPIRADEDDRNQEGELAALDAIVRGRDPGVARAKAIHRIDWQEFAWKSRVRLGTEADPSGNPDRLPWFDRGRRVLSAGPPAYLDQAGRQAFIRDQMILVLSIAGFSLSMIAGQWDITRERAFQIASGMRSMLGFEPIEIDPREGPIEARERALVAREAALKDREYRVSRREQAAARKSGRSKRT